MSRPILLSLILLGGATATAAAQTPGPPPTAARPATLLKEAAAIQRKTVQLRGLHVRRPIAMGVQSRAAILERVERKLARDNSAEEIQAEAEVLKRLGLLPPKLDYRQAVLELLRDQVAGYYDPSERKLHLADWLPMTLQAPALSHEICHALQDQHFDLKRFIKPQKDNSDRQLAQTALVEGDCTGVMLEYVLAPQGKDLGSLDESALDMLGSALAAQGSAHFKTAPPFLRETLLFPYLKGLKLVQRVRALQPWSAVSQMFKRPPETTEQVLHPDKYSKREAGTIIRPAALPSLQGHTRTRQDVLGEWNLFLLLSERLTEGLAKRASEGWGGDLLQAFRLAGEPLLIVHLSTWDSEADALEFANASRHWLLARKLSPRPAATAELAVYVDPEKREWSVQRVNEHVLLLLGAPTELRATLQQEVWAEWRIGGRRVRPPASQPAP